MKTLSGYNVAQGGESKWAKVLPEMITNLSNLGATLVQNSADQKKLDDAIGLINSKISLMGGEDSPAFRASLMPQEKSAFQAKLTTPDSSQMLDVANQFDTAEKKVRASAMVPKEGTVSEYDVMKPGTDMDSDKTSLYKGASAESMQPSAFGGKKSPWLLETMEMREMGVPASKIKSFIKDQMEIAMMVAKLPSHLQKNLDPIMNVLEMQQKWLLANYGRESEAMKSIQKYYFDMGKEEFKAGAAKERAEILAGSRKEIEGMKVKDKGDTETDKYRAKLIAQYNALDKRTKDLTIPKEEEPLVQEKMKNIMYQLDLTKMTESQLQEERKKMEGVYGPADQEKLSAIESEIGRRGKVSTGKSVERYSGLKTLVRYKDPNTGKVILGTIPTENLDEAIATGLYEEASDEDVLSE